MIKLEQGWLGKGVATLTIHNFIIKFLHLIVLKQNERQSNEQP